jgi:decaprenylphospho-beta-D-erythro-pentofuranosid-2-ulose 2-reductase
MTLQFRHAIVVGASSGIGECIARRLAKQGAAVALIARRLPELEVIAKSLKDDGATALVYAHDAASYDATPELFDRITKELGGLDLIVYAAGVMPSIQESEYDFSKDRAMIEVNLLGAMAWFNLAAARFESTRSGTIVGISSIAGERGRRGNPAYCTSKAAFTTYLEALRNRVSRYGVNVVTIKPGFVYTRMTQGMQGLLWLISADRAAEITLAHARRGKGCSAFVPARWSLVATIIRWIPSWMFRKMNV